MENIRKIITGLIVGQLCLIGLVGLISITSPIVSAYTAHTPIRIESNADFDAAHGVTGGNGTITNPWIIENYEIDGTGNGNCIYFGETTDYFIVRNCRFYNANGNSGLYYWNTGLVLYKVQNGKITNNTIESNIEDGIFSWYSNNNFISNNTIKSNNDDGIKLWESNNNEFYYNTIYSNNGNGIHIQSSTDNKVSNNTVYLNNGAGISFLSSNSNTVFNNTAEQNSKGIYLSQASNNIVSNNTVSSNTDDGIYLTSSGNNRISNNTVSLNLADGITLWDSSSNTVNNNTIEFHNDDGLDLHSANNNIFYGNYLYMNDYGTYLWSSSVLNKFFHNNFINNTSRQAYDSYNNQWDNGYPSGGNYWSDYLRFDNYSGPNQDVLGSDGISDTEYSIPGGTNVDNYPLMFPTDYVDNEAPTSSVDSISQYWFNTSPLNIQVSASDNGTGIANVTLRYRYSADNSTWDGNTSFGIDVSEPWNWTFDFPDSGGYYEFYSIAIDNANNTEVEPISPDTVCAYDSISPIADAGIDQEINQGSVLRLNGTKSTDNIGIANYEWNFTYNSSMKALYGAETQYFEFNIPGNYTVTLAVTDAAGNQDTDTMTITVIDTEEPVANAGTDQQVDVGTLVIFDGSGSTDNLDITNYSWTFTYNGTVMVLYEASSQFKFWTTGNYTVILNITDEAGNWDTDTLTVNVSFSEGDQESLHEGANWLGIAIVVIILSVVGIVLYFRKRKSLPPPE